MEPKKQLDKPIIYLDEKSGQYVMYDPNTSDFTPIPYEQAMGSLVNRTSESPGDDQFSKKYDVSRLEALRRIQGAPAGSAGDFEDRHLVNPGITKDMHEADVVNRREPTVKVDIGEPDIKYWSHSMMSDPDSKVTMKVGKPEYFVRKNIEEPVDVEMGQASITGRTTGEEPVVATKKSKFPGLKGKLGYK